MSTTQNLFQQAQLAEAAYTDLTGAIGNQGELLRALDIANNGRFGGSFSATQATEFVTHWKVISHQPDQPSGFSATLFDSLDQPGQYTLAIRGTAGVQDLLVADGLDIVADGLAMDQIVDLYNFWKKLTAPQGGQYQIANLATLETETNQLQAAYALGVVAGLAYEAVLRTRSDIVIDSPSKRVRTVQYATSVQANGLGLPLTGIEVTGHSLGGHLSFDPAAPGVQVQYDDLGNVIVNLREAGWKEAA